MVTAHQYLKAEPQRIGQLLSMRLAVKHRSDSLVDYFLVTYFFIGLMLAFVFNTWFIAISVGGICLIAYYSVKIMLPDSTLYQYVLSVVLGIFMAQYIYEMHGLFEMHFFAFIGSAVLITYQKWKLQIPMLITVVIHHLLFNYIQISGYSKIYFIEPGYFTIQTFFIHVILVFIIFFICGLWSYQLKRYYEQHVLQSIRVAELEKREQLILAKKYNDELLTERNNILESIDDTFFALDKNWLITYWNRKAEESLFKNKEEVIGRSFWEIYPEVANTRVYGYYQKAAQTGQTIHFEDYFEPLRMWYEADIYPAPNGLSVFSRNITERKLAESMIKESEKRYSELFDLSPIPMWIYDVDNLTFLDVNKAAIENYGYGRAEFLSMTINDIIPVKDILEPDKTRSKSKNTPESGKLGVFSHKRKNGEIMQVDVQSDDIIYKDKKARFVLAQDITERLNYLNAIEEQNKKLLEISWIQSHVVRAPLASIMGLVPMLSDEDFDDDREQTLKHLLTAANELDHVIRNINTITRRETVANLKRSKN